VEPDSLLAGSRLAVTVAIPTYRRPGMLASLLGEVRRQATALDLVTGGRTVLLVADNDPDAGARPVVGEHPGVQYLHVPQPGIAAVRDACLREAPGVVLQFIDDDELPAPDWLETMVGCWLTLDRPDALAGSVLPRFDSTPSPWVQAGGFFDRSRPPTGTALPAAPAGNLLVNLATVRELGIGFDPRLGLRGGEDTLFSRQLVASGGRIAFCREGIIHDLVPDARNNREWVLRRAWHHGNTSSTVALWDTAGPRRAAARVALTLRGSGRAVVGVVQATVGTLTGDLGRNARGWRLASRGRGIVAGHGDARRLSTTVRRSDPGGRPTGAR